MMKLPNEFDSAVLGVSYRIGWEDCIVYDVNEILRILMQDMLADDALEHFMYNIAGSYAGETTPIFLWERTMKEIEEDEHEE